MNGIDSIKYTPEEIEANKTEFLSLLAKVNRPGMKELTDWLVNGSDFFIAPSSSKFHGACDGGLCAHSLNVYKAFKMLYEQSKFLAIPSKMQEISEETIIIVTLLHDFCKVNFYVKEVRVWKDEAAAPGEQWKHYYTYKSNNSLPLGHGEKSVIMIQNFMRLTMEEALAIRWHMGMFDVGIQASAYERPAFMESANTLPLVNLICLADYYATFLMEYRGDPKIDNPC